MEGRVEDSAEVDLIVLVTFRALSLEEMARDVENCPPCAGMIQIRFDGRSFDQLPLSPAHRTPVFGFEYTRQCERKTIAAP